ncbi:MAG: hypothetical protein RIT43_2504 [Bacteroidota bacterium]|jgi:ribosomal protein L11 methyltransferase
MDYIELKVDIFPREPWAGVLVAQLAENGFDGFVDTETGILAYAPTGSIDIENPLRATILESPSSELTVHFEIKLIPHQNWNEVWESEFEPVEVEGFLTILAPFHNPIKNDGMVVEIMPRMSFGTGHHQTTWMMSRALFDLDPMPLKVLDMGTGTGVLAIISEKLGAGDVLAVDIEEWSVENARENALRNECKNIKFLCGDLDVVDSTEYELILANINKNVLKNHLPEYANKMRMNGTLFLSGFFYSDCEELISRAGEVGFEKKRILTRDNWAAIEFQKK